MSKSLPKQPRDRAQRRQTRRVKGLTPLSSKMEDFARDVHRRDDSPLEAFTPVQGRYIEAISTNQLTFGIGPAGTGKSFVATCLAADALMDQRVERIIITRPVVEAGEELGFLPGELSEKVQPYFAPVRAILERRLGRGACEMFMKNGRIEFMPLAYMRGHTLDNSFIILDEAQNTTPSQMKLFLTRLGENTRVVVDGDPRQKDLAGPSGLIDALKRLRGIPSIDVVEFTRKDVVRSGLVQHIVEAYEEPEDDDAGLQKMLARSV